MMQNNVKPKDGEDGSSLLSHTSPLASTWWLCWWYGLWYGLCGLLHELAHHAAMHGVSSLSLWQFLQALFRYTVMPEDEEPVAMNLTIDWPRHAGWIASLVLCVTVHLLVVDKRSTPSSLLQWASTVTCLEAISTDLLFHGTHYRGVLFCGNFGIIMLNPYNVQLAMDTLEQMINVTMMRGAQSGGVVCWQPERLRTKGVRCRVVNYKRTDLSKLIRQKCQRNMTVNTAPGFYGHTRFATSSISSFDGTHPHQWCPPVLRHVFLDGKWVTREVSSYITHNGDLDFYKVQGKSYDLGQIQQWLALATHHPMITTVDSAAIAGLVDLIRAQRCFVLSIRFAILFQLPTSSMSAKKLANDKNPYPTETDYVMVAKQFETLWNSFLRKHELTFEDVASTPRHRLAFVSEALPAIQEFFDRCGDKGLLQSIDHFLFDEEKGSSLSAFVMATVDAFLDNDLLQTAKIFLKNAKGSFGLMITCSLDGRYQFCMAARGQPMSLALYPRKGLVCYGSEQAAVKAGLNYRGADSKEAASYRQLSTHFIPLSSTTKTCGLRFVYRKEINDVQITGFVPGSPAELYLPSHIRGSYIYKVNGVHVRTVLHVQTEIAKAIENISDFADDQAGIRLEVAKLTGEEYKASAAVRLDLDDLGGEICLLDWNPNGPSISSPNRHLSITKLMNNRLSLVLAPENDILARLQENIYKRMTPLEDNELIAPIPTFPRDPVMADIRDIPKICNAIQEDWHDVNLNRLTAWNLRQCILERLEAIADGTIPRRAGMVDILLTGCEVSLWLAEQFATDLQKSFPGLFIQAMSSNKLLGLFGQEISIPAVGYPVSTKSHIFEDAITIIVSHSGGTFAPLACSNLLQSQTKNIFVVSSEWDTQIGKQLRGLHGTSNSLISSRIFSTGVGIRPAEPASVSVVATHQLLTNIFIHIALTIIGHPSLRRVTRAAVTVNDLEILERCNRENVYALEHITGVDIDGDLVESGTYDNDKEAELRKLGDLWADHVLENVKSYIMSFFYIVGTVTAGYPLVSGIGTACGVDADSWIFFILRFLDSLIYFWLPQINIIILRLFQGRNLKHRMVQRTVVIADIPWVAQCAEAFLSKLFANSYSIAGVNVLSGNPNDHLVHRHTHRVVRGTLLACGRPDGRLAALTSAEAASCLSVNQASSIQSFGGTCESVTIGHNPYKLPLSHAAVFLDRHRPKFMCETILDSMNEGGAMSSRRRQFSQSKKKSLLSGLMDLSRHCTTSLLNTSKHQSTSVQLENTSSATLKTESNDEPSSSTSVSRLLGIYSDLQAVSGGTRDDVMEVVDAIARDYQGIDRLRQIYESICGHDNKNGELSEDNFVKAFQESDPNIEEHDVRRIFRDADVDDSGGLTFAEFLTIARMPQSELVEAINRFNQNDKGLVVVKPSEEEYFGEKFIHESNSIISSFSLSKSQTMAMELYESRIASLQRFVSMCVMFHQMGARVQRFFQKTSFGMLGYNMDRTHSIMRIATTASPVSGADVRDRMAYLAEIKVVERSAKRVVDKWRAHRQAKTERIVREFENSQSSLRRTSHMSSSSLPKIDESRAQQSPKLSPRVAPKLSAFSRRTSSGRQLLLDQDDCAQSPFHLSPSPPAKNAVLAMPQALGLFLPPRSQQSSSTLPQSFLPPPVPFGQSDLSEPRAPPTPSDSPSMMQESNDEPIEVDGRKWADGSC